MKFLIKFMTPEEKAEELDKKYFPAESNIWARDNYEANCVKWACLEMYKWVIEEYYEQCRTLP